MVPDVCPVRIVDIRGVSVLRIHKKSAIPGFRRGTVVDRVIELTRKELRRYR